MPSSRGQLSLYEILQVSPRACPEVIHAAYRVLARGCHPDVSDAPDAAERMRGLNAAYAVLSDREQRARYDVERMPSGRTVVTTRIEPIRRGGQVARSVGARRDEHGDGSAVGRVFVAVLLVSLGVALACLLWVAYDSDEDAPFAMFGPRGDGPSLTVRGRWRPSLEPGGAGLMGR